MTREINTSKLNEAQKTLYFIAENMKMDKTISEEGYEHFQQAIKTLEQESKIFDTIDFAIDASNGGMNYFVGFRNGLRYAKSLINGEEPQFENCTEQEPTVQDKQAESEKYQKAFDDGYANGYAQARFDYEQEPCDAISREAVIKAVDAHTNEDGTLDDDISVILEDISSVTQKPKIGHWISLDDFRGKYNENGFVCSECGEHSDYEENFCPGCGCRMESEPQESKE